jgi:hypothetical protein
LLQKFAHGWVLQTRCSGSCKNLTKIGFSYRARACVDEGFVGLFVFFWLKISWGSGGKKRKKTKKKCPALMPMAVDFSSSVVVASFAHGKLDCSEF